jgi:hypothetical protein
LYQTPGALGVYKKYVTLQVEVAVTFVVIYLMELKLNLHKVIMAYLLKA